MIDNDALLAAGLELMRQDGKSLTKLNGFGRSMRYVLSNGQTVRVRTCNDHILIVLADKHSGPDAKLNIEGTDWLLVVMPEIERTSGKVRAYFVPTRVAVDAARSCHQQWLDTNPNTKGDNRTWNLWFSDGEKTNNFDKEWSQYRLRGTVETNVAGSYPTAGAVNVKTEVETARQRISKAAGVLPEAVRITIEFGL